MRIGRIGAAAALACVLSGTAGAHYFYVNYQNTYGPYTIVPFKFDLTALNNNTVPLYVSDQGPSALAPGDSIQAIVSELRSAADVWNHVGSSNLRIGYGGLYTSGTQESSPGIDVDFSDDVPPGLLAQGGVEFADPIHTNSNGQFIPIRRSKVLLHSDMSEIPSYSESFFVTLVHEIGHTFGLQHSLTSSVMSTLQTSASSKAAPLAADDIAAISLLYPAGTYASTVGSISGTVTMKGAGVALASVVAISAESQAINMLTNPDGRYQIDGIPPGQYLVYAHPLPPAMTSAGEYSPDNIIPPIDSNGNYFGFGPSFSTEFFPGVRDWTQAQPITVTAGQVTPDIDFNVKSIAAPVVYGVRTYGFTYSNSIAITSPPVDNPLTVVASGVGLIENNAMRPDITVNPLGSDLFIPPQYLQLWSLTPAPGYLDFAVYVNTGSAPGPKHLIFGTSRDLYILPSALTVVQHPAPVINSITPMTDSTGQAALRLTGTDLYSDTRIVFDGLIAAVSPDSPASDGSLIVYPPQGPSGYTANVVALNSDGQSSLMQQATLPTYSYASGSSPSLTVSPAVLTAGNNTVTITGMNTNFVDGQTVVGFGTSDAVVTSLTVNSPTQLTVAVAVAPGASSQALTQMTVTTGLQIIYAGLGFQVQSAASAPSTSQQTGTPR